MKACSFFPINLREAFQTKVKGLTRPPKSCTSLLMDHSLEIRVRLASKRKRRLVLSMLWAGSYYVCVWWFLFLAEFNLQPVVLWPHPAAWGSRHHRHRPSENRAAGKRQIWSAQLDLATTQGELQNDESARTETNIVKIPGNIICMHTYVQHAHSTMFYLIAFNKVYV